MRASTFLSKSAVAILSAVALLAFAGLSACGSGGGGVTPSITISPMQASVPVNQTAHFLATVNNSSSGVTWAVSGVAGGNSTVGTIQNDGANPLQGDYVAPASVPTSNPVSVTAVLQGNTNIVSNAASVSVTAAQGLQVNPASTNALAGATVSFSATLNGAPDNNVTWSIVPLPNGGNPGTIGSTSGVYTAPLFPPPGAQVTVKGVDGNNSGTSTVTIQYGLASLQGTYAFAYTGDDGSGFFTAAGSFTANGNGSIGTGVEDALDLNVGATQAIQISGGNYTVGPDGRTQIQFTAGGNTVTLEAALTTNLHGLVIEYDNTATGSGTIDQQTTADFGSLGGPFVFSLSGADGGFNPLGFAGAFTASAGNIPNVNAIVDVNDGGDVNNNCPNLGCNLAPGDPDTSLSGSYSFDANNPNSGRGTITMSATNFGIFTTGSQVVFAFYMVDHTHLHLVEIDNQAATSGDIYQGLLGGPFGTNVLAKGNYPMSLGGTSTQGAYAAGGIFGVDGTGDVSGGIFDNNSGGNPINKGLTINKCGYGTGYSPNGVDAGTGRVDLLLGLSSGTGCGTPSHSVDEFALYPTALTQPSAVMLEIDSNFITGGNAYAQQGSAVSPTGSFAFNLTGQGIFHNQAGSYQQDAVGQLILNGTAFTGGNVNINNYGSVLPSASVTINSSTLGAVSTDFGRGTMKLTVLIPQGGGSPVYNMAYYYVDPNTYLLIDLDNNRIANGVIADQF